MPTPSAALPRPARRVLALTAVVVTLVLGVGLVRWVMPTAWFHVGVTAHRAGLGRRASSWAPSPAPTRAMAAPRPR